MRKNCDCLFILLLISFSYLLYGCEEYEPKFPVRKVKGYRPIYASEVEYKQMPAKAVVKPGKAYLYKNYLLVNESKLGFHVIDDSDPKNPNNLLFFSIPGNTDMSINGNVLYANSGPDLITLDISDPVNIKLIRIVKEVFSFPTNYPPEKGNYFECVKGKVVGWEITTLHEPKCYR